MSNLVIVALPEATDQTWKVSSEKKPHLTLLFLGDSNNPKLESIVEFVQHAVDVSEHGQFYLSVDRRDKLGPDEADVLHFRKDYSFKWINQLRNQLLQNTDIRTAYDSVEQYEEWNPHLTLGYPATPAHDDKMPEYGLSMVSFDRIAIWTGDYEGPDFRLEWPERELQEVMYSGTSKTGEEAVADILDHHGVKGMKWGQRKAPSVVEAPKNALTPKQQALLVGAPIAGALAGVPAGPVGVAVGSYAGYGAAFASKSLRENIKKNQEAGRSYQQDKKWEKDFQKARGFGFDDQKFTHEYNSKWSSHDFSKEDWNNPSPKYKEYVDGYFKEMNTSYAKQFAEHYGSSPSGKYEAVHEPGTDLVRLRKKDDVQHAAEAMEKLLAVFRIKRNDTGLITGLEEVEDALSQSATGEVFVESALEHFGIKGMKWGVRRAAEAVGRGAKRAGRALAAVGAAMADSAWQQSTYSDVKHEEVHNHVAKKLDNHIERLQRSPKYRGKDLKADSDLRKTYYQDVAKVTSSAYRSGVKETYGSNYTGTKSAHYVTDARGPRIEVRDKKTGEVTAESPLTSKREIAARRAAAAAPMTHAATDEAPDLSIDLTLDDNGQIIGVGFVPPTNDKAVHSAIQGEIFAEELFHYGVRGMHWGQRKAPPTPVAPTASSHVPHGTKAKTKIKAEGGENHPAHEDAIKVAQARAKLAKSGPAALSNKELKDVANRVRLEQEVKQLVAPAGKKFVTELLIGQGKQGANQAVGKQVRKGLRI